MKVAGLAAVLCLLIAPSALAQTARAPVQILPSTRSVIQITTVVAGPSFDVSTNSGTANGGTAGPVALQSFRLGFGNGDHKLKTLTVRRLGTASELRIGDNDGNDPFEGRARYLPLAPAYAVQTVNGNCLNWCTLPIAPAPGQVFVLTGFSLQHGGEDVDIEEVGIMPDLDHGMIQISYSPFGMPGGVVHRSEVSVQYVLVPQAAVTFQTNCSTLTGCAVRRGAEANVVLQGFHCRYDNRQAHLLVLGIDTRTANLAEFQDNNLDDGGRCMILIAGLR